MGVRRTLAALWTTLAEHRAEAINHLMWDKKAGLYFEYDFVHQRRSTYSILTTFYPLMDRLRPAGAGGARRLPLSRIRASGGLQTSTWQSGDHWAAPFG